MARVQVETCMFCGQSPCACSRPDPKPRASRARTTKPKTEAPVVPEAVDESPAIMPQRRAPLRATQRPEAAPDDGYDDAEQRRALTILCRSGLVGADSIEEHRDFLNMEPTAIRALIWRTRREESLHGSSLQ